MTVSIIDREDTIVRRLARDRRLPGGRPLQFVWDGRGDDGRVAADGRYRVRIGLRDEGRTVTLRREIALDTTPPRPTVTITSPGGTGRALFPAPGVRLIRVRTETPLFARPRFQVYRSDAGSLRFVTQFYGDRATGVGGWDGRAHGRPVAPGLYAIVVRTIDRVSNAGVSPPLGPAPAHGGAGRYEVVVRLVRTARTAR